MSDFARLSEGDGTIFLVRWRGRQEGPYPGPVIASKLAAHEIGLLHEIYYEGKWITIRDYIAVREAALQAEQAAREKAEQTSLAEGEKKAQERAEKLRAETLAEERRRNDLLAGELLRPDNAAQNKAALRPHRGGQVLAVALAGLIICGPLCVVAWIMGNGDLREMDAGLRDEHGRSSTSAGRMIGVVGTVLWIVVTIFYLLSR